jgi:hypothetical protein
MLNTRAIHDPSAWNATLRDLPCAHILPDVDWK